jgi:radical SAM superfamily enzyme YgiQ (UPF0313 family)
LYKVAFYTPKRVELDYIVHKFGVDLEMIALETYLSSKVEGIETLVSDTIEDVIAFSPDLFAISAVSASYPLAIEIAKRVKAECGSLAIIGGIHITTCPESFSSTFELGVTGEGENTLVDIVNLFKSGKTGPNEYANIPGVVFDSGKGVIRTKPRPQIADLGTLPIPNRKKWVEKIGVPFLMSSRGCPFKCYFCSACKMWNSVRYYPVDHVVEEIKSIVTDFDPMCIRVFDDIFTLDKGRVKEITSRLIQEGLTKDVSYMCWSRADLIDDEYVDILKKSNFVNIAFGVESGSEELAQKMKGGTFSVAKVQKGIEMLHAADITVSCAFILGTPGETVSDLDKTYAFIENNADKLLDIEVNPMLPYPGTPLWDYAKGRGLVSADMDWTRLSDTGMLVNFDFDNYIYLNEAMPKETFYKYVEKFKALYKEINFSAKAAELNKKTFPPETLLAKLKTYRQSA